MLILLNSFREGSYIVANVSNIAAGLAMSSGFCPFDSKVLTMANRAQFLYLFKKGVAYHFLHKYFQYHESSFSLVFVYIELTKFMLSCKTKISNKTVDCQLFMGCLDGCLLYAKQADLNVLRRTKAQELAMR